MDKQLLDCPFCGQHPKSYFMGDDDGGYWAVYCGNCNGSETPFVGVHMDSEEAAIIAWNTRQHPEEGNAELMKVVNEQAKDEGLWCETVHASEAYLQKALRRLHEVIEGKTSEECGEDALTGIDINGG